MEVTADPSSSAKDLMDVINPDQALTATILKMANSAFFGLSRTVSSLQQALSILGFKEIQNLVLAKAVFNSFQSINNDGQFDVKQFWEHSFLCGLASKIIAIEIRGASNDFFVAGLIHDIGKLVMYMALPAEFSRILETAGPINHKMFEVEKTTLGVTHDELGMRLLKRWMFPENLLIAIGFHHRPKEAKQMQLFPIAVQVADLIVHLNESSDDDRDEIKPEEIFGPEIINLWQSHGLKWDASDLKRFQQELKKKKEEEAATLNLLLA
jgi:HD-like signal output (HDOD) protein